MVAGRTWILAALFTALFAPLNFVKFVSQAGDTTRDVIGAVIGIAGAAAAPARHSGWKGLRR